MKKETGIYEWALEDAQAVQIAMIDWIENWYKCSQATLHSGRMQSCPD